ncbi:MAG TPA: polysaccharide deacetylase family protein [Flavitalea sp.]|nr:polysaccharide deacetylase family protein [Flavitalea sp.]
MYLVKSPWLLKKIYPFCVWDLPTQEPVVYLTFDDGPHETATPFVLDTLQQFNAKATFFCIGKNVVKQADLYKRILHEGHRVGNHTFNHLNGWKVSDKDYVDDILHAKKYIDSNLFRPPYGRITNFQAALLNRNFTKKDELFRIVMWNLLSADFDEKLNGEKCAANILSHIKNGSIVVYHDSEKAYPRLKIALPRTLDVLTKKGFRFEPIRL